MNTQDANENRGKEQRNKARRSKGMDFIGACTVITFERAAAILDYLAEESWGEFTMRQGPRG